jgi:hypothetical protein
MSRFIVTFAPAPCVDGIRALRWLLKIAGRRLGLRAIDVREGAPTNVGDALVQLHTDVTSRLRRRS